jgi:hypothetical protein
MIKTKTKQKTNHRPRGLGKQDRDGCRVPSPVIIPHTTQTLR